MKSVVYEYIAEEGEREQHLEDPRHLVEPSIESLEVGIFSNLEKNMVSRNWRKWLICC